MARYHISSLKPHEVSANLRSGTFALKWPEETNKPVVVPIAVNLSVDPKGFYLICLNKVTKEIECFDIALIYDTRTGSEASLPRGATECDQINIGALDVPLSSKWLTIYYGNSFIPERDLRIIHFCFHSPSVAREWTEKLFEYGHNPYLRNLSSVGCLEKFHSRIIHGLVDDRFDKKAIPVRSLIQFLCKNTRDVNKESKILKALELLELPCRTEAVIDPDQFTFNKFVRFYMQIMERHEIDKLFDSTSEIDIGEGILAILPGGRHRRYLGWEKVRDFIVKQNDARGDAFGMDYYDQKAKDLVKKYTQHDTHFKEKGMSDESFLRYLLSLDNSIVDPTKFGLFMDMDKPLAHYFISSSHNTYLIGSQLTGRASTEMYRQVLLSGCRCIELDVVDSEKRNDEPEIKHRNTPVRSVPFIHVIVAIRESAFKVSPYPVILSIENHCGPRAQAKMAQYLTEVFGDKLISQPLKSHPTDDHVPLPSPNDLKYKILIKNKKLHQNAKPKTNSSQEQTPLRKNDSVTAASSEPTNTTSATSISPSQSYFNNSSNDATRRKNSSANETRSDLQSVEYDSPLATDINRYGTLVEEDDNSSSEDDALLGTIDTNLSSTEIINSDQATNMPTSLSNATNSDAIAESKATKAMSDLVHYTVPVRFVTFARAEERNRSYELSSFAEDRAQSLIREYAKEFVAYNQRQLSRIYPRGTRFDSSNYNPYLFWPVGCQMVALNYQTLDTPMQVNLGLFSFNGCCGYIEKPASLCQSRSSFDPKCRTNVENVVGYQIDLKVISGQFLCQDREPTYVDIEMYGMYADATKRHEYRLRAKRWNGFQAVYDETDVENGEFSVRFSKVILPEMASLRFAVSEEDGTFIGQTFIPVAHLRPGYRHVVLRNQINIPVQSSSLFVYIRKDVHVDAENKELIDQLVSPTTASVTMKEQVKQTKYKPLSEQRSHSVGDLNSNRDVSAHEIQSFNDNGDFPTNISKQSYYQSTNEISKGVVGNIHNKKRHQSTPLADTSWYQNQLIASSQLYNRDGLCQELTLKDIEHSKHFKRKRETIQTKVRRISFEYDKKIQIEEERFQKCLDTFGHGIHPAIQRTIIHPISTESVKHNIPYADNRTSSFAHPPHISEEVKQSEARLLDVYSTKFHLQNELEYKLSKEYYNEMEKYINEFYSKQLNQINTILKQEQGKVKEDVRVQMKNETKKSIMTETDREKIVNLKEKIRQMNIEAGALAIRKLQEMHEMLQKTIRTNLQIALDHLHKEKDLETKHRFVRYSEQLNEIKHRLQNSIHGFDYNGSSSNLSSIAHRSMIPTSASLSFFPNKHNQISKNASTFISSTSPYDRSSEQKSINNRSESSQADDDEFTCDSYQNNETTRL